MIKSSAEYLHMSDSSLTITYTITSLTTASGMSTIVWNMAEAVSGATSSRTGDKFKTSDLASGVESTDSDYDKLVLLQTNFETLAAPYFKAFAVQARAAMDADFTDLLDDLTDSVEGFSVGNILNTPLSGSVVID